jgi:CheY-like chemotaxis protein
MLQHLLACNAFENLRRAMRTLRILVVDDNEDIRNSIAQLLVDFGYEVSTAIDGVDAFDQLMKVSPPDVLIADLAMPRMTGWELAIKLRGKPGYATMPIIAMSAAGLERRSPVSFDAFLPKPFSIEALEDALHSVARAAKLHCQLPASAILLQING